MKNKFSSGGIIEAFTRRVYEGVESYIANPFKYAADAQLQISPDDLTVTLAESDSVMPDCICVEIGGLVEVTPEDKLVPSAEGVATLVARFCT